MINNEDSNLTIKNMVVLVKLSNDKVHPVALWPGESDKVLGFIHSIHGGSIRITEQELEGIELLSNKTEDNEDSYTREPA